MSELDARPYSEVLVTDLSGEWGGFAAALLSDLGAEVVRRETPRGDEDVVLLAGSPAELAAGGLDPFVLVERDPRLIVAAISPFGLTGPRAEWRTSDTVAQALGGMLHVNGHPDEPPLRAMGPQAVHAAGIQAAIGVGLALLVRRRRGHGQVVDVSVHESVVGMLEHVTGRYRERGVAPARQGTLHWSGSFRVAACRDAPVLLSHYGDWTALIEWVKSDGAADDLADPRWADPEVRRVECGHVFDVLARWARHYRSDELLEQARLRRLPFAPVAPLARLIEHPQLWARGFFRREPRGAVTIVRPLARAFDGASAPAPAAAPQPATPSFGGARALDGIRVLDFTWVVAGPVATRVLADHGAEVIKVEAPPTPDGPDRRGGLFGNLNRGKRSVAIDLGQPDGVALAHQLARRCDVVIDNFSPRVMRHWGLDAATLRASHPRLIAVGLSGFGASGPMADAVSYGPTLQAHTGFTWHMRHPGGAPAGLGFSYSDMVSGYCAALAIVAALYRRERTGAGARLDLSQLEILASCVGPWLERALRGDPPPAALGNSSPDAPGGVYRCRDDADGRDRWCAAGESDQRMEEWTRALDAAEVAERLQRSGVAAGLVADARDLDADPQLAARGYWAEPAPGVVLDGALPRLSATPGAVAAPGPRLGEHADDILRDLLGLRQSAIDDLRARRLIR